MAEKIDSTKVGPLSYRQLQQKNREAYQKASTSEDNRLKDLNIESNIGNIVTAADIAYTGPEQSSLYRSTGGEDWVGRSQYDPSEEEITEGYLSDVGQYRAENQPWYDQIANGIAKGVVLAGTTFVSGTAGLLYGIGSAINNNDFSKVWDNDFEKALQEINDYSEKNLANYYSHAEEDGPWYNNIFTANFIGDKFLKNLGFTVGAYYSGGLYSKGLGAILKIAKVGSTAGAFTTSVAGSFISAFNEGRTEALNNTKEKYEAEKTGYSNAHQDALEQLKFEFENSAQTEADYAKYLQGVKAENELYNQTLGKLEEARARMGNMDLLMNVPLLTAGNLFQFGKMLSRGAGYAMIKDATKPSVWKSVGKAAGRVATEAHEEMAQAGLANIAGKYHFSDPEAFYKSKGDPEYSKNTMSFLQAAMQGTMETLSTPSVWEEGFIGGLTGFMGMPRFRGFKNKQGQFQSPIVLEEGVGGVVRDYFEQKRNYAEVDAYIQKRISDPKFVHAYQSVSRHNAYQDMMDKAVEEGDTFEYKNAEQSQMVSDIIMFARAGRLDELKTMIKNGFNVSDENLQELVNQSGIVKPTGEQYNLDDEQDKKEVLDIFTKNQKKILDAVDEYTEVYSNLMSTQGAKNLNAEQKEELTWMQMQINNFDRRGEQLTKETKDKAQPLISFLNSQADRIKEQIAEEEKKDAPNKDIIKKHKENLEKVEGFLENTKVLLSLGVNGTRSTVDFYQPFMDAMLKNLDVVKPALDPMEYDNLKKSLTDLKRLNQARTDFSSKLNEYLGNPSKQLADHERSDEENSNKAKAALSNELREKLNNAKSVHEYEQILDEADEEERAAAEEELENNEDENYKTYKSFKNTRSAIATNIVNSGADAATIEDAMNLWQRHSDAATTENDLFNTNSDTLINPTDFSVDAEGNVDIDRGTQRLSAANYLIQQAIEKHNKDKESREEFDNPTTPPNLNEDEEDYEDAGELLVNPKPTESTGSDATPKIPDSIAPKPVGQDKKDSPEQETSTKSATESENNSTKEQTNEYDETPTEVKEKERSLPIGDISSEDTVNENDEISSDIQDDNTESLKDENGIYEFYAPTIPEIHIEEGKKGKNGDYRPFNVVVREKEGKDYDVIFSYLKDNGAFKFLNEGKLKRGDTIHFMIDPKFENEMRSKYDWYTGPTIFMTTDSGQVVGSLPSDSKVISRYKGLSTLTNKIKQEYENATNNAASAKKEDLICITNTNGGYGVLGKRADWAQNVQDIRKKPDGFGSMNGLYYYKVSAPEGSGRPGDNTTIWFKNEPSQKVKDSIESLLANTKNLDEFGDQLVQLLKEETLLEDKFTATPITKVSKIMVGKIPYTQTDQDLNTIPNAKNNPKFEIITNPNDKKRGRLYLLIPNGAGGTSRVAVRVKHFNANEYDLNSAEVKDSKMGGDIIAALEKLNTAQNAEDKSRALAELSKYIYLNDVIIKFNPAKDGHKASITIAKRLRNEDGTFVQTGKKDDNGNEIYATSRKLVIEINRGNDSLQEIIRVLQFYNLPFQVSAREINKSNYNKDIIEEGILFANISSAESLSTWFITDYIDDDGVRHSASKEGFGTRNIGNNDNTNTPINSKESTISGQSIDYNGSTYYVDGKIIRDKDGNNITNDLTENQKNLFNAIAWADECYNSEEDNGLELINGKIKTPDGLYIDRKNQRYLTKNEIDEYEREFAEREKQAEGNEDVGNINLDNEIDVDDTQDPNAEMSESKIGYYEIDGKLHKGFVRPIGTVAGINISMIKQPIYDLDLSTGKKTLHIGNSYYIVFPNGNTFKIIQKTKNVDYDAIGKTIISKLEKNPDKVKGLVKSEGTKKALDNINNNQENKYQNKNDKFAEPNDSAKKPKENSTSKQEQGSQEGSNTKKENRIVTKFEELTEDEREILKGKGWTEEKFNSVSQIERDYAVACFII